jgi:hypothetical protein
MLLAIRIRSPLITFILIKFGQIKMWNLKKSIQNSFYQQIHSLLNIKMLKLTIKISLDSLLHVSVHSDHPQGA